MKTCKQTAEKKVGIIGIGNLLLSDEGFGIHVLHYLEENFIFPENVQLMDAGTASIYMGPFIEDVDSLFVFDVVDIKAPPGSIHCFSGNEVRAGKIPTQMSPHQLGLLEMVDICALRGKCPDELEYICVVPERLESGLDLSPLISSQVLPAAEILFKKLEDRGIATTSKGA